MYLFIIIYFQDAPVPCYVTFTVSDEADHVVSWLIPGDFRVSYYRILMYKYEQDDDPSFTYIYHANSTSQTAVTINLLPGTYFYSLKVVAHEKTICGETASESQEKIIKYATGKRDSVSWILITLEDKFLIFLMVNNFFCELFG